MAHTCILVMRLKGVADNDKRSDISDTHPVLLIEMCTPIFNKAELTP